MTINGISGAYGSYGSYRATSRTTNSSALKISVVSEDGLSGAVSTKVSNAMTDEYIEQIKAEPFPEKRTLKAKKKWRDTRRE